MQILSSTTPPFVRTCLIANCPAPHESLAKDERKMQHSKVEDWMWNRHGTSNG